MTTTSPQTDNTGDNAAEQAGKRPLTRQQQHSAAIKSGIARMQMLKQLDTLGAPGAELSDALKAELEQYRRVEARLPKELRKEFTDGVKRIAEARKELDTFSPFDAEAATEEEKETQKHSFHSGDQKRVPQAYLDLSADQKELQQFRATRGIMAPHIQPLFDRWCKDHGFDAITSAARSAEALGHSA